METSLVNYRRINGKDILLNKEGKLGVARSIPALMNNIEEMIYDSEHHFLKQSVDKVLANPWLGGPGTDLPYDMAYLPGTFQKPKRDFVEVTVKGTAPISELEERAKRNLAYKVLLMEATAVANYEVERNDDHVTVRGIPVVFDTSL